LAGSGVAALIRGDDPGSRLLSSPLARLATTAEEAQPRPSEAGVAGLRCQELTDMSNPRNVPASSTERSKPSRLTP
jgi:hypothetical protein